MAAWPRIGALAVVLRGDKVLLAQRGKEPNKGLWGYPGGHVEFGETVMQAAVRELHEETGLRARALEYLTNFDLLIRDRDGLVQAHYLLVGVACSDGGGDPRARDDVTDARWVPVADVRDGGLAMHDRVPDLLELARARDQARRAEFRE